MFETRSAIQYKNGAAAAVLPRTALAGTAGRKTDVRPDYLTAERALDEILDESFPASDPPSWNSGTAHLNPVGRQMDRGRPIHTSREGSGDMTFVDIAISFAGATGIMLFVPLAILLVGLPIVLSVRAVVEAVRWLFAFILS